MRMLGAEPIALDERDSGSRSAKERAGGAAAGHSGAGAAETAAVRSLVSDGFNCAFIISSKVPHPSHT